MRNQLSAPKVSLDWRFDCIVSHKCCAHTHTCAYLAVVELTVSQDVLQTCQRWREWPGYVAQLWGRWWHIQELYRETAQTMQKYYICIINQLLTSGALYIKCCTSPWGQYTPASTTMVRCPLLLCLYPPHSLLLPHIFPPHQSSSVWKRRHPRTSDHLIHSYTHNHVHYVHTHTHLLSIYPNPVAVTIEWYNFLTIYPAKHRQK